MHIIFSQKELEQIERLPFEWKVKESCPAELRYIIERKLNLLREKGGYTQ